MSNDTKSKLENLFSTLESQFDHNNENSLIEKFNKAEVGSTVSVSEHVASLLNLCKDYYNFTDKKFNVAIAPLISLWQFDDYPTLNFTLPDNESIDALIQKGFKLENLDVDKDNLTAKKSSELTVNLGGILKGYVADLAGQILIQDGHSKGYVSVGGSSLYLLSVQTVSIKHPRPTELLPTILSINDGNLKNRSLSTSGDYEKYYTLNGKKYNHLINPFDGMPTSTNVASATVIGANGSFGDAVTTALCLCQHAYKKTDTELITFIKKILSEHPDYSIYVVYDGKDGKELITNKLLDKDFTLQDVSYSITNI